MTTELGEPTADRGYEPPGVVATMSMTDVADLGVPTADRGDPAPAVAETMAVASPDARSEFGDPTPDRGSALPAIAHALSTWSAEQLFSVVREVAEVHTGTDTYAAIVIDPPGNGADAEGLRAGIGLFGQASGELGDVLRLMRDRDETAYAEAFGSSADALLATLTSPDRSTRLAPVAGSNLWDGPWPATFAAAAAVSSYRYAQNEFAVERRLRPIAATAERLGLAGLAGISLVYERVVALGADIGSRWIERVLAAPISDSANAVDRLRAASTQAGRAVIDRLISSSALAAAEHSTDGGDVAAR